jgi:hypothetical protein
VAVLPTGAAVELVAVGSATGVDAAVPLPIGAEVVVVASPPLAGAAGELALLVTVTGFGGLAIRPPWLDRVVSRSA